MIKALLVIRLKQVYRGLIGIGMIRLVFLIGLIGFVGKCEPYQMIISYERNAKQFLFEKVNLNYSLLYLSP